MLLGLLGRGANTAIKLRNAANVIKIYAYKLNLILNSSGIIGRNVSSSSRSFILGSGGSGIPLVSEPQSLPEAVGSSLFTTFRRKPRRNWTKEEDSQLLNLCAKHGRNWAKISTVMVDRAPMAIRQHYYDVLEPASRMDYIPIAADGRKLNRAWSKEEDAQLLALHAEYGNKWTRIAKVMRDRSSATIQRRYKQYLDPTVKRGGWTAEEDKIIMDLGPKREWTKIAKLLPGRSQSAVRDRYKSFEIRAAKVSAGRPVLTMKRVWTEEEDVKLLALYAEHGPNKWKSFVVHFMGRSHQAIRERYTRHLDPSLKKGGWTAEEDKVILALGSSSKWTTISKQLPGRSDKAVRDRHRNLTRTLLPIQI